MHPSRIPNLLVSFALITASGACRPGSAPPAVSSDAPAPAAQAVAPFPQWAVRLTQADAARLARAGRDSLSATLAEGLRLEVWAPEGLVFDPVAITLDSLGRAYFTRTQRFANSEIDIRRHPSWMIESMTFDDVEDKRRFYQRELAPENSARNSWLPDHNNDGSRDWRDLTVHSEGIYRVEDTDRDGIADASLRVVQGFSDLITDVAHGLMVHNDEIIATISPDLWRLRDTDGDGVADTQESLAHGFDVHIGYAAHGQSGVLMGMDGRLYWKMSDRGFNIVTREGRRLASPHAGAILRAEPDGSNLEIFATGIRNPQEFAFDEYGNLIAADNDGDNPGETERLIYITSGSDAGWRQNWQFGKYGDPDNNRYKPWMDEGLYRTRWDGQAAYITPPIASFLPPSGMTYNPGTALSPAWRDYFFVTVTASASNSSVQAVKVEERGAGFAMTENREIIRGLYSPGIEFGPDGRLYFNQWISGAAGRGRGRIFALDAAGADAALRAETQGLIAQPLASLATPRLAALLGHADQRVRQKAQFGLVDRRADRELMAVARQTANQLARVHALWGLGQLARREPATARNLERFLADSDPEIRAQAARMIGEAGHTASATALIPLLADAAPRVRYFAAEALGLLRHTPAMPSIVGMLAANNDADVYLRQAGAIALGRIGDAESAAALADHPSRAVRIAAVVALRRMRHPSVARFLRDADEYVVTEAARAINDEGAIEGALPDLAAALEDTRFRGEPLVRRAINANLRLGTADAARRVAAFAARPGVSDTFAAEALAVLGVWPKPSILDRVDGHPIGPVARDSAAARAALATVIRPLFANGSAEVQAALAGALGRLRLTDAAPLLLAKVSSGPTAGVRAAALSALQALGGARAEEAIRASLQDPDRTVRTAALAAVSRAGLPETTTAELLSSVLSRGSISEQQTALAALGQLQGAGAREALARLLDQLDRGVVAPEIQLDVAEAARATGHPSLVARLDAREAARASRSPLAMYTDALHGGNAQAGQRTINNNAAAQCNQCHVISGAGIGSRVGPDLRGIGSRLTREQLLEALVHPNARIAPGYGPVSVMPPMGGVLTRRELRDVVEYLTTLR